MDDSTSCQEVTFDTSGLELKDKFGSLTLESCQDEDCLVPVEWEYTVVNTGNVDIAISTLERGCNGDFRNLIEDIPPDDPRLVVPPGGL